MSVCMMLHSDNFSKVCQMACGERHRIFKTLVACWKCLSHGRCWCDMEYIIFGCLPLCGSRKVDRHRRSITFYSEKKKYTRVPFTANAACKWKPPHHHGTPEGKNEVIKNLYTTIRRWLAINRLLLNGPRLIILYTCKILAHQWQMRPTVWRGALWNTRRIEGSLPMLSTRCLVNLSQQKSL